MKSKLFCHFSKPRNFLSAKFSDHDVSSTKNNDNDNTFKFYRIIINVSVRSNRISNDAHKQITFTSTENLVKN